MIIKKFIITILIVFFFNSCSNETIKKTDLKKKSLDLQVLQTYEEGLKALEGGDVLYAAQKFNEVEILFPRSDWASKSALMAAYSYYKQDYYKDAVAELKRFIRVYPKHKNLDYAYYLLAISYYEQIVDEKKDLQAMINAKRTFEILVKNYSNTEYALDAEFKINLINDILASKEMYIGRYYFDRKNWISAIKRFRTVIDDYETTIYTEEALYRLVEVHYTIGLKVEAEKYAKLLGYNYQSSQWYEKSYSVFNEIYKKNKKEMNSTKKTSLISRFKSLLD